MRSSKYIFLFQILYIKNWFNHIKIFIFENQSLKQINHFLNNFII